MKLKHKFKRAISAVMAAVTVLFCIGLSGCNNITVYLENLGGNASASSEDTKQSSEQSSDSFDEISESEENSGNKTVLTVHFMDVGQGDGIFIELPSGKCMLIDAGESNQAGKIIDYIHNLGYDSIDYMVATHPHSDHIGGMADVISAIPVKNAYISPASNVTIQYTNMLAALVDCGTEAEKVKAGYIISDDDVKIEVVAPKTDTFDNFNDASVVILLTYKDNKFLFTGDAEKSEEDGIWSNIKCDVLKIGHHGSVSSTSANFLKKTEPTYAVISCAVGNYYGHPHKEVTDRLKSARVKLFRTDLQGDIVFTSDGNNIEVNTTPTENYGSGSEISSESEDNSSVEPPQTEASEVGAKYVLNTSTMKIHYPSCSSVKDIKEENKAYTDDYEWAIEQGYTPCGKCKAR